MNWVALKMLTGDRTKYFGIVFGVSFAALLMAQQSAIFCGLMRNTTSQIRDIQGADLWVMDKNVQFIDDVKPLSENDLYRVRGVPGVKWAVRLYKGLGRARLTDGNFQQVIILGLDNATLVGAPPPWRVLHGSVEDLRRPDAVFIDEFGWRYLFGDEPFVPGAKTLELNDRRAVIVGVCECSPTFQTFPILYCTYSQALQFIPQERKTLSFVLAKAEDGVSPQEVGQRIEAQTGHKALTDDAFVWTTIGYYLKRTGIPINFGITVALGFVVGCAIAGQTFYLFTIENLKQFGALKAMGVGNLRLVGMILLQAAVVGVIGYGIGVGGAALFGYVFERVVKTAPPAFYFPWQILALTAVAVAVIVTAAALVSMRRVLFLEAGVVFR
ncbi:ABC transporter permease [Urbifossiella limnaea]|uniref:FtsX-like permease family protein n=1 Tax=Urbifossiella limnaea TaxID=2528023 RepID=A0A517XVE6_9BACT|nr:ABC transporter permease [Urbifossiella limnaea]QDU21483.1 FtsX-like permease family protein [Urbifossiella limnaea]